MERLIALMLIAPPFVFSAAVGLLFPKAWQRILTAGLGAAGFYAVFVYFVQKEFVAGRHAGSELVAADPLASALEVALLTFPIGLGVGVAFHLIASFLRNKEA